MPTHGSELDQQFRFGRNFDCPLAWSAEVDNRVFGTEVLKPSPFTIALTGGMGCLIPYFNGHLDSQICTSDVPQVRIGTFGERLTRLTKLLVNKPAVEAVGLS